MNDVHQRVIRVFLASPSDLATERQQARDEVARFNSTIGRLILCHIDLLGWEDTLPGYQRPQDIINKDVDRCDLFVGILWRRFGSPTGQYSSGFEEEFRRATKRGKDTGEPEVALFFKTVGDQTDPGEQLKGVI